jgi:chorismate mutase/prephenate dehydratase
MTDELDELRQKIDEVDRAIVDRLDERARLVKEVGRIKKERDMDLYVPGRERQILNRLEEMDPTDFPVSSLKQIYREIIATCLNLEKPVSVAYLGPEATFTHLAALKQFGRETDLQSLETVSEVFDVVERGETDFGIVPIESSNEGAVKHTLDRFLESNVSICSECYQMINLYLLSREDRIESVETLYSHPQALSQARDWIERNRGRDVTVEETSSTAEAARLASESEGTAAVASEVAADIYDLNVLARHLEDQADNYTRFLVLGTQSPEQTGDDKTSVAFSVKDRPGALYDVLQPFGEAGINMTKIESRPSKQATWDYVFFVDFLGHRDEEPVKTVLEELKNETAFFKLLGSYPREEPFD